MSVVITPMDTLVTNSASTRPLIARKPACGLSASRRPAMQGRRPPGLPRGERAHRHGQPRPGDDEAGHDQQEAGEVSDRLAAGRASVVATAVKYASSTIPATSGISRHARGGRGVDSPGDAERRDLHAAQREPRRDRGGRRDADRDEQHVHQGQRQVGGKNGAPVNGIAASGRADGEEQREAERHTGDGGDGRLDGGDERRSAAVWRRPAASPRSAVRGAPPTAGSPRR